MNIRLGMTALLAAAVFAMAGCGSDTLDDQFIFGKNRISCAGETITLEVPFEMGIAGQMADLAPKDSSKVNAEGHNRYMQILVTGEATDKSVEALAAEASSTIRREAAVENLKETKDEVRVGDSGGIRLTFSFDDVSRDRRTALTVKEYIFREGKTLWRVIYQYRTGDPMGQALTERVEGRIVQGATF